MDTALEKIEKTKSDRVELEKLSSDVDPSKQQSIFNDMKDLFDTTLLGLEEKRVREIISLEASFNRLLNEQR